MTTERQGEIALMLLKRKFQKQGLSSFAQDNFRREIGNVAKAIGIEVRELEEFAEILVKGVVDDMFNYRK